MWQRNILAFMEGDPVNVHEICSSWVNRDTPVSVRQVLYTVKTCLHKNHLLWDYECSQCGIIFARQQRSFWETTLTALPQRWSLSHYSERGWDFWCILLYQIINVGSRVLLSHLAVVTFSKCRVSAFLKVGQKTTWRTRPTPVASRVGISPLQEERRQAKWVRLRLGRQTERNAGKER